MKIRNFVMTLMCSVCAGVMLIGCSSDDPTFVKKPKVSLSRTEDGEDERWYIEGKEMSRETFGAEVVGNAWMECERYRIEEDGSLTDWLDPNNFPDGYAPPKYYFDNDKIYAVFGAPFYTFLREMEYEVGDPVGYLPNEILPVEIDSDGMLNVLYPYSTIVDASGKPFPCIGYYCRYAKISKEDFDKAVERAKEDMERDENLKKQ